MEGLPPGHPLTSEIAIRNHTMYPLVAPFLSKERAEKVLERMVISDARSLDFLTGSIQSGISRKTHFYSCPRCDAEDIERWGEPYWHRLFQAPGVSVCPEHRVHLNASLALRPEGGPVQRFVPACSAILDTTIKSADLSNSDDEDKLEIARSVQWLLFDSHAPPGIETLRQAYLSRLAELGFVSGSGRIAQRSLRDAFHARFPTGLANSLDSPLGEAEQDDWLARLLRRERTATPFIRHLLFQLFLDWSPAQAFTHAVPNALPSVQQNQWPCRNPICPELNKSPTCAVTWKYAPEHAEIVHTVRCLACGYTYSSRPHMKRLRVVDHGEKWRTLLRRRWLNLRRSLREIAREFRADPMTIKRHAAALDLTFPRLSVRPSRCRPLALGHRKALRRAQLRTRWLTARQGNPRLSSLELRGRFPRLYAAIYRSDRDWLLSHQPKRRRRAKTPRRVDWQARDSEFRSRVRSAEERIRAESEKPRRVSATALCAELGAPWIERHREKLPRTWQSIHAAAESRTAFAIRRVRLAAQKLLHEGHSVTEWRLCRAAGLRRDIASLPSVQREMHLWTRPSTAAPYIVHAGLR